jgi:hypothetical protein
LLLEPGVLLCAHLRLRYLHEREEAKSLLYLL